MEVLQSVAEPTVWQAVDGCVNGAIALNEARWIQPHAGKDAAERIHAGTELIEGIGGQASDADQAEIDKRLGIRGSADGERESHREYVLSCFHC